MMTYPKNTAVNLEWFVIADCCTESGTQCPGEQQPARCCLGCAWGVRECESAREDWRAQLGKPTYLLYRHVK